MGGLADALRAALGGPVASLIQQAGSSATLHRSAEEEGDGGSAVNNWQPVVVGLPITIFDNTSREEAKAFAREEDAVLEGLVSETALISAGITSCRIGDGIEVTTGFRAGECFTVVAVVRSYMSAHQSLMLRKLLENPFHG